MTTLAFVIPTWRRPEHLKRCVASIARQVVDGVVVHIVQDGDLPETSLAVEELRMRWPFVKVSHNEHSDYAAAFRAMFRAEPEADWVWTFGDDDLLRPDALKFMMDRLPTETADFIHVAEARRASGVNNLYSADTLLRMVNRFGWIDMTGFITGNITRGPLLAAAAETPRWDKYARTAYVQSCILLEAFRDRPTMFIDIPLIESQDQEQTEETQDSWRTQDIPGRYLKVVDAIELMFEDGILTEKVPPAFFRYLSYHLWDRHLTHFIADYLNQNFVWTYDAWDRLLRFAKLIDDEEYAKQLVVDVEAARGMATLGMFMMRNLEGLREELEQLLKRRHQEVYPYSYAASTAA